MPEISSAPEPEWSLLRAACSEVTSPQKAARIRELLASKVRWEVLFHLAERHGVLPILFQTFSNLKDELPPAELSKLNQSHQANIHKALFLSRELIRIVDRLSVAGIEVIPYKGLALAETVYEDIALRQTGDIDLLIRATDFKRVREAVGELGYRPHFVLSEAEEKAYLESGYECAFDGSAGPNLLEVQWAIQPRFYAVDVDMEGLFRRAVTVRVAGLAMKSLSREDMFLVLALHAAKHVWGRLIWLCDLARISNLPNLNWEWIGEQAQELGIVRILRVTLSLVERLLSSPFPRAAEDGLPKDSMAMGTAEEIERYISSDKTFDVESLAYFRLMLQLRERRRDRIRFVSRLVLTPGPGEWATVQLPRPLFPIYPLIRVARLVARAARGRV
jgi:hypothetical protein